jgi:hypothetical protein
MSRRRTGPGTVRTRAGGEPPLMRVVQHEEPERVGPLRQRTAEHHQRRRFGPDGRVVEEHQAIR